ncbi:hypothetical protein RmaAA213_10820 [Rhodothermus marinus]|nr:hypothetical protein RmaAA213_10820 [Rhodothermus marinus]BBM72228.1 hypothetical protein RmaAA338_10930 [Rhodothermus marinus]
MGTMAHPVKGAETESVRENWMESKWPAKRASRQRGVRFAAMDRRVGGGVRPARGRVFERAGTERQRRIVTTVSCEA